MALAEPANMPGIPTARDAADDTVALGPLTDLAGFMLRLAQVQIYESFFAEFGQRGIRPGQLGILVAIRENPGIRQGILADALHIKWSNMAKIMRLLEDDGLVERRVPESDRRAFELRLTGRGRALVDSVLADVKLNDHAATARLSAGERATLLRLLAKLTGRDDGSEGK